MISLQTQNPFSHWNIHLKFNGILFTTFNAQFTKMFLFYKIFKKYIFLNFILCFIYFLFIISLFRIFFLGTSYCISNIPKKITCICICKGSIFYLKHVWFDKIDHFASVYFIVNPFKFLYELFHPDVKWLIWKLEWIDYKIGRSKVFFFSNQACSKKKILPIYI